jgi:hypothetical protein
MPTFTASAPAFDERLGRSAGGDVAARDGDRQVGLDLGDDLQHAGGVAVRGVHHDEVHPGVGQRLCPLQRVVPDPDRRGAPQPALVVLGGVGVLDLLVDVLDGDQPGDATVVVDDGELLDAVLAEDGLCLLERRALRRGDEPLGGHDLAHGPGPVVLEAEVAVGQDADESVLTRRRSARPRCGTWPSGRGPSRPGRRDRG